MAQDSYLRIKKYSQKFKETIRSKGGICSEDDVFAVLMEKWNVSRLLMHPDCYKIAAMIGVEENDGPEMLTISLLAVGKDGKVLPQHLPGSAKAGETTENNDPEGEELPGEEVWPEKKTVDELDEFLP